MPRASHPSSRTRAALLAVAAVGVVTLAAASPQAPAQQSQAQPPVRDTTVVPKAIVDPAPLTVQQGRTGVGVQDSVSPQGVPSLADSAQPSVTQQEAPAAVASWPVDPATGRTLINGQPVVGRVFLMTKVDGLRAYDGVSRHYVGEPLPPATANVATGYVQPPPQLVRRHRGMMVQATLWSIDGSRSATENRHYRPSVSGATAATLR